MRFPRTWRNAMLFFGLSLLSFTAHAGLILTIADDQGNSVTVEDLDGDGLVGYYGALGTWSVNATTGITNPLIGSENVDAIDLNSVNVSGGQGTLTITLTRTGLEKDNASWIAAVGGTTQGTIAFQTLVNDTVISNFTASTLSFSDTDSGSFSQDGPYSISLVATITHAGPRLISSFDYLVQVPEPSSLTLLGAGLFALGLAGYRRRQQVSVA